MNKYYKSALDKVTLKESEKDRAKALYQMKEKEAAMRVKKFWRPVAVCAVSLAVIVGINGVLPMLHDGRKSDERVEKTADKGNGIAEMIDNYFTVTAYAKELTETGKVYPDKYDSITSGLTGNGEKNGISFCFEFPVECKGENIDTITYKIKEGAFSITNPAGKGILVSGKKLQKKLNAPWRSKESEKKEKLTYEREQYQSFTVKYDRQKDKNTCVDIVDSSEVWSREKKERYRALNYQFTSISLAEEKALWDFLIKDLGITCTVKYKDGSTESKKILISTEIADLTEIFGEEAEDDSKNVIRYFSIG